MISFHSLVEKKIRGLLLKFFFKTHFVDNSCTRFRLRKKDRDREGEKRKIKNTETKKEG